MSNAYIDALATAELLRTLKRREKTETEKAALAARLCSTPRQERPRPVLVLDTNVLMDIWVFDNPSSCSIRSALREGRAMAVRSVRTDEEFADVLSRAAFALPQMRQREIIEEWLALSHPFEPGENRCAHEPLCRDRDDQKFLHLASCAGADMLVTRDKLVLKAARKAAKCGLLILTPESAAAKLGEAPGAA
jgi:putative PIN family toxin of toxin-antitoxin system